MNKHYNFFVVFAGLLFAAFLVLPEGWRRPMPPISAAEGLFGGHLLAVRGADCVVFLDWAEGAFIRKIDVVPTQIFWNVLMVELVMLTTIYSAPSGGR